MSPCPPPLRRYLPRKLGRGHAVALSAVAVAGFGLLGLRAVELPQPAPVSEDDRLRVEVVAPIEPKIVPGSVMEVGELVDGFQGLPPPLPPVEEIAWSYEAEWEDVEYEAPPPRRIAAVFAPAPPERRDPPPRYEGRWFGFDAPRRDFQAERAARRARMEEMDRRAREAHEARRREWIERREEELRRRDLDREMAWRDRRAMAEQAFAEPAAGGAAGSAVWFRDPG